MKTRNQEALELSEDILRNFELSELPTNSIILKCIRLARLLNDIESLEWLQQEASGFDVTDNKLSKKAWSAAVKSGRTSKYELNGKTSESAFTETIAEMENTIKMCHQRMEVSSDPNISISSQSSFNPTLPKGNSIERNNITNKIGDLTKKIEKVKFRIYHYVLNMNYELKFGNITEDIFTTKRNKVDVMLNEKCPQAIQKFISIYENLKSNNQEDWANAVHSCRRILKEVADVLMPPSDLPYERDGQKSIKVGNDQYVNRLIIYIESKADSNKFTSIVGSHLRFIGERLDSITDAANKGTHSEVDYEEAERYIIYTYLLLSDILLL